MSKITRYDFKKIEKKWQQEWQKRGLYRAEDFSEKPKYYALIEFPYPSGDGLHVGHVRSYTAIDAVARWRRMQGHNVLYPIGWDAFGLPTENYAIKNKTHPAKATEQNVKNFTRQIKSLGLSFDWSREINTTDPKYYKWTQWIFLQMFKAGLAYRAEISINWCPQCKVGLANEEVVDGRHERCGTLVVRKIKQQWLLRITQYADRLIEDLKLVDFPERVKSQQINWIGKSEGALIDFPFARKDIRKVVLMHGKDTNPTEKWYPWFINEINKRGITCFAPHLPEPNNPKVETWINELEKTKPDENTVLVGHSRGGVAILRWLENLPSGKKVKKVILVATNRGDDKESYGKFFGKPYDFKKIKSHCNDFIVLHSRDDEWVPFEAGEYLAAGLGADFLIFNDKGHFGKRLSKPEIPELLNKIFPKIEVFTTRADTLFGATYLVLAPEHPFVASLLNFQFSIFNFQNRDEVKRYVEEAKNKSDLERTAGKEKTGVELKGITATNPINNAEIPVWVADYVLPDYGTGAIMAVPAHDERDFEFAKKYSLPVKCVIDPMAMPVLGGTLKEAERLSKEKYRKILNGEEVYTGNGILTNSDKFNKLSNKEGADKIVAELEKQSLGKKSVSYKLRDWVFSRQHYWGEPIPLVFCEACKKQAENSTLNPQPSTLSRSELTNPGWVAVPEDQLPVELPNVKSYEPTDTGESPLAAITDWVNTKCPKCGGLAKRETDTMPNWAGSNWYYLAYLMQGISNFQFPISKYEEVFKYWMPIDLYNGGMEHTTLHLLYSRFVYKFLYDQGFASGPEPYQRRRSHGIVLAEDGRKMSKSYGNVVNPDEVVEKYGADAMRLYEMFMAPFEQMVAWSSKSIVGVYRFLERVWKLYHQTAKGGFAEQSHPLQHRLGEVENGLNKLIKKITDDLEQMKFNTAIAAFMDFSNRMGRAEAVPKEILEKYLILLAPFAPHISEELWQLLGHKNSIHSQKWPKVEEKELKEETIQLIVQVNGKVRDRITAKAGISQPEAEKLALASEKVQKYLQVKKPKKIIYTGKLINLVVS